MAAPVKTAKKSLQKYAGKELLEISLFNNPDPHSVLGPHLDEKEKLLVINAYLPAALEAWIKIKGRKVKAPMKRISPDNIFQAVIENTTEIPSYKIGYTDAAENIHESADPYSFTPQISDIDIYLFKEGSHLKIYEKLGARTKTINKIKGVLFNVWAPNAKSISITGRFNNWKSGAHQMKNVNGSGVWELFIPGLEEGEIYKYAVKSKKDNTVVLKSDPYACQAELRPDTASVVNTLKSYKWKDEEWLDRRKAANLKALPLNIYEVHLGSWKKDFNNDEFTNEWGFKNYRQLAHEIGEHLVSHGYTHIELMPVMEHPLDISWGYQVINYFAPTSRYGTPEDFMYFVDHMHSLNIGVILDWVPAHFPMDAHGLADFDSTQIYAYESPQRAYHKDWGTLIFDYGRKEVCNFLISNALFWLHKYHIDGLRVDAVASMLYLDYSKEEGEWEPNIHGGRENLEAVEFIKTLNEKVHIYHKGAMMIAEESTSWPGVTRPVYLGGLGFDLKWNMGWMHDTLDYFSKDPIYRKFHHNKITFSLWYSFNENFLLPISHDEVVYGKKSLIEKMPGDLWQKFANLRLYFGFMFGHPGKKLNFMTNDIAQYLEWNCEDQLTWGAMEYEHNMKFNKFFIDLQNLYKQHKAFFEIDYESRGFNWIDFSDSENSVLSFVRYSEGRDEILLFTFNMTPVPRYEYILGVPVAGFYNEILNSDAEEYGGTGLGNLGGVHSVNEKRYEWDNSVKVTLPPLGVNIYSYVKPIEIVEEKFDAGEPDPMDEPVEVKNIISEEPIGN